MKSGNGMRRGSRIEDASSYASSVNARRASEILDASHEERSNIPAGMCFCQNSMGRPNTRVSKPAERV